MDTFTLLQHYWWLLISLLGAFLVFLLFVQGGQGLLKPPRTSTTRFTERRLKAPPTNLQNACSSVSVS